MQALDLTFGELHVVFGDIYTFAFTLCVCLHGHPFGLEDLVKSFVGFLVYLT